MNNFWEKLPPQFLVLAPMAGITDSAFRQICIRNGADVVYSEMTAIDALHYGNEKTLDMLKFNKRKERPVVIQLFGKRPETVKKAVEMVEAAGFDGIDINFGCPAKKVVAHGGGVTLLRDLNLAQELVHAVTEAANIPVAVKTRISINTKDKAGEVNGKVTVFDFINKIKDFPVKALMLHGRSYEGSFSAPIDFDVIKEVKQQFDGVVIGNGGINTPEQAKEMFDKTGVDGIGLARGLYGRPYLFKQIKQYLNNGIYDQLTLKEIKKVALDHAKLLYKLKGEYGMFEIRKHLVWYFKGFPNAAAFRQRLVLVESVDDVKKILREIGD